MQQANQKIYEKYPLWIVLIVNILMLLVYVAGAYIMFQLSLGPGILYLVYIAILEFYNFREGCIHCCYFGQRCAFGKGLVARIFFKRGDPDKFREREIKFKDLIPQLLVVLIPLGIGIALLISRGFNILILLALLYPLASWFLLNPIIYGKLACPHCRQGSICCPALKFFTKGKK